jgi:hypothetical protein
MRLSSLIVLAALWLATARLSLAAQGAETASLEDLAYEWAMSKADERRRTEILDIFDKLERSQLTKAVAKWIELENSREGALDLALALNVPGINEACRKAIGTHEEKAAIALLNSFEKSAAEFLFARWQAAAVESDSFKSLTSAFTQCGAPGAVLEKFKPLSEKNDVRGQAAYDVLTAATDFYGEKDEFNKKWRELKRQFDARSKLVPCKFVDGLAFYRRNGSGFSRVGPNARFGGGGMAFKSLPKFARDGLDVRVTLMFTEGGSFRVQLATEKNAFTARLENGVWEDTTRKATKDTWIDIRITVRRDRQGSEFTFIGTVSADGKPLISPGAVGEIADFSIISDRTSLVVALIEFIPIDAK